MKSSAQPRAAAGDAKGVEALPYDDHAVKPRADTAVAPGDDYVGGLLSSPHTKLSALKGVIAFTAEFLGTMIFTFVASSAPTDNNTEINPGTANHGINFGPYSNGFGLLFVVFLTANVSGGHVNPAVTLATLLTGHINVLLGIAYIIAQIAGAITGMLLVAGLVPGNWVGIGNNGTGCYHSGAGVTRSQIFGWELVQTWALVSVVYAVAIGKPSFGNVAPIAVGFTLLALCFAGASFTGTAANPARALAPAIVFNCYWNQIWIYVVAELCGGALAGLMAGPLYGVRAAWLKRRLPAWANLGMSADPQLLPARKQKKGHRHGHDDIEVALAKAETAPTAQDVRQGGTYRDAGFADAVV